jgi:outer membrane protein OmpA-like peptidoglycan-associated protein/LysM repeat protein
MRLERLATMVDEQTRDRQQTIIENEFLTHQQATDQWFYLELDPDEREMVDQLIANGWNLGQSSSPELHEFVQGLDHLEKERIDRMMGNQQLHLELQTDQSIAITKEPVQEPLSITGRTEIFFDSDQHTLRPEARKTLKELQQYLKQTGKPVTLIIEGHTDNTGSKSYNQELARHRTQAVSKIFEQEGDLIKVSIRSLGEGQPAFDNQSPAGRQMNRRVELKISGLSYQTNLRTYLVRPNVTLGMIATATGYSESEIILWNGPISKDLRAYQPIRLPAEMDSEVFKSVLFIPEELPEKKEDRLQTVAEGENLFKLAREYNTSVQKLEDLNQTLLEDLTPGQKIQVK